MATYTDDFERTASTGLGANWTDVVNGFDVVDAFSDGFKEAKAHALTFNFTVYSAGAAGDAQYSEAVVLGKVNGDYVGVSVRGISTGGGSCYAAFFNAGSTLYKLHGGTWTDTGQAIGDCTSNDTIRIEIDAASSPTITVKKNGTTILTWQDTGSVGGAALGSGQPGLAEYSGGGTTCLASWAGGDVGGAAPAPAKLIFRNSAYV